MLKLLKEKFLNYVVRKEGSKFILLPTNDNIEKKFQAFKIQFMEQFREIRRTQIKLMKEIKNEDEKKMIEREVDELYRYYIEKLSEKIKSLSK